MTQLSLFTPQERETSSPSGVVWHLYVDGASRNNPGPAGAGIYILKNGEPFLKRGFYLGEMTNNQAEYTALLLSLFLVESYLHPDDELHIFSDSQLMIRQLQGSYKVRSHLKSLYDKAQAFLSSKKCMLNHIEREKNKIADALANQGIDKKISVPHEFQTFCSR